MMQPTILMIGTFDSKGGEYAFLREQLIAQGARQVGHRAEVGDAPLMNPAVNLPGVEGLGTGGRERRFKLVQFELSNVEPGRGHICLAFSYRCEQSIVAIATAGARML